MSVTYFLLYAQLLTWWPTFNLMTFFCCELLVTWWIISDNFFMSEWLNIDWPNLTFYSYLTGWNSCKIRQRINMIRLWNRLINIGENRLTKRVFKWDYIICKNWCFEVKEIFSSIQLQRVYDDMNECSLNCQI